MASTSEGDLQVQAAVQLELAAAPDVEAAAVGVWVKDGIVALSGEADDYRQRQAAKRAALRVPRVRALIDDMTVHPRAGHPATCTDIAKRVERALRAGGDAALAVQAEIEGHRVTLTGEVGSPSQRAEIERSVEYVPGVHEVESLLTVAAVRAAKDEVTA